MASNTEIAEPRNEDVRFERRDLSPRVTISIIVGVLVGLWVTTAFVYFYFVFLVHHRANVSPPALPIEAHGNPVPPEPRLQQSPREDLKAMRGREDWQLTHYSWVNKQKGIISIPIEQAIQLLARRGIPPQKQPANLKLSQPQAGTRLTGFEGKVEPEPR
jgi:hypothetical protein